MLFRSYRHPGILEASVVARPDEQWGETPCAFITPNGKVPITEADVIQFCRKELPHYMVPRSVVFGPLPKTATGKIQKHVLRTKAKALGNLNKNPRSRM